MCSCLNKNEAYDLSIYSSIYFCNNYMFNSFMTEVLIIQKPSVLQGVSPPSKNEVTPFSSAPPPFPQEISIQLGPPFLGSPHQNFEELISPTLKTGLKNNTLPLTK